MVSSYDQYALMLFIDASRDASTVMYWSVMNSMNASAWLLQLDCFSFEREIGFGVVCSAMLALLAMHAGFVGHVCGMIGFILI